MLASKSKSKGKMTCPVCGMDMDESSEFKAEHGGETYYFCSEEDKKEFQQHPTQYLKKEKAAYAV